MNVLLRLLDLTGVFVGLREGVYQISQFKFMFFKDSMLDSWQRIQAGLELRAAALTDRNRATELVVRGVERGMGMTNR
jgi:hypothetical protein